MRARLLAALGAMGLLIFGLYMAVASVGLNAAFYEQAYARHGVPKDAGVSQEALSLLTGDLIAYLKGELPELDRAVEVNGVTQPAFGSRERAHMADVRALFAFGRRLAWIALAIGLLCLLAALRLGGRRAVGTGLLSGIALWIICLVGIGLWAALDFNGLFTVFHQLSFDNDLWQLDPQTELLIRMMPTGFFTDAARRIGLAMGLTALALACAGLLLALLPHMGKTAPGISRKGRRSAP